MGTILLYENEIEEKLHLNAIRAIAKETGIPEEKVGLIYEAALEKMKEHARVKDFLPILVKREVMGMLLKLTESAHEGVCA